MAKPRTKSEIARALNVHVCTLRNWLNRIKPLLLEYGYQPNDKYISGKPLELIETHFCITEADYN